MVTPFEIDGINDGLFGILNFLIIVSQTTMNVKMLWSNFIADNASYKDKYSVKRQNSFDSMFKSSWMRIAPARGWIHLLLCFLRFNSRLSFLLLDLVLQCSAVLCYYKWRLLCRIVSWEWKCRQKRCDKSICVAISLVEKVWPRRLASCHLHSNRYYIYRMKVRMDL